MLLAYFELIQEAIVVMTIVVIIIVIMTTVAGRAVTVASIVVVGTVWVMQIVTAEAAIQMAIGRDSAAIAAIVVEAVETEMLVDFVVRCRLMLD